MLLYLVGVRKSESKIPYLTVAAILWMSEES